MMNEETYEKMIPELYEQNATLLVNGHVPVQGIIDKQEVNIISDFFRNCSGFLLATTNIMKLWQEWETGVTTSKTDEIIVSKWNDLHFYVL